MFSDTDAKEIFQLFPPQKTSDFLPSLILLSGAHGFATLAAVQAQFRSRVTREPERISVHILANDLDVNVDLVLQLARTNPCLALLNTDNSAIVPTFERDGLSLKLREETSKQIVQISDFSVANDLDDTSVTALLKDLEGRCVVFDTHIFSKTYEKTISENIEKSLEASLSNLLTVDILYQDLPGTPPRWFISRVLRDVLESRNLLNACFIKESAEGVQCSPKQLIEKKRDIVINDLESGALAYVDLQAFQNSFQELYSAVEVATQYVRTSADVDIVGTLAISIARKRSIVKTCIVSVVDDGYLNVTHVLGEFPDSVRGRVLQDVERDVIALYQADHGAQVRKIGDFLLKPETYDSEQHTLVEYAEIEADLQWQKLRESPSEDIKYSLTSIAGLITKDQPVLAALAKEKVTQKIVEEQFWAVISQKEGENEAQFSEFWIERVQYKSQVYHAGLAAVEDEKLRNQLSDTFATYAKKELIPESITKARLQGLVLSRKTRKNIMAKELLELDDANIVDILATLKKFNKKQGIASLNSEQLTEAKHGILDDLIKRMQRQKKSDGPVLFLTLVLILFAKHYDIVYATGKFAPKLLKQLKSALPVEQYEQMEKWKEAAKTSSLTTEDRSAMKMMAEA